ncbi:MAG: hypothetical protein DKM22_00275 [Candidatus Melainabacteria bacterium]|nr:MAG: hypothetical protein DKM22_00275 [Candidatus Melainabacteria bacterium]
MNELLSIGQKMRVVPQDFEYANRGHIVKILDECFVLQLDSAPTGLKTKQVMEFYSPTKFGTLFFNSAIAKFDEDKAIVLKPKKHRFLQRRTFTRIKFAEKVLLKHDEQFEATAIDLAAGGLRVKSEHPFAIDDIYDVEFPLSGGKDIVCKFSPVLVQRSEDNIYTAAGKFVDLPYKDRMRIIQYCLRKDIEYNRK